MKIFLQTVKDGFVCFSTHPNDKPLKKASTKVTTAQTDENTDPDFKGSAESIG